MPQDTIGNWSSGAKSSNESGNGVIKVIRREQKMSKGQMIMATADKIFPMLMGYLKDKRDTSGILFQPAHVRGMALNVAEILVKRGE